MVFNGNSSLSHGNLAGLETFLVVATAGVGVGVGASIYGETPGTLEHPLMHWAKNHPAHDITQYKSRPLYALFGFCPK